MPSDKQIRVAERLVELGGIKHGNLGRAMIDAGYSEETAKTPQKVTESKGFKEIMDECGLTDDLILTSLADDIKAKPKKRVLELRLAAEIKGMTKRDGDGGQVNNVNIILFNNGNNDSPQLRSEPKTISVESAEESCEIQVFEDS